MYKSSQSRTERAPSRVWSLIWPLIFLCAMTVLSMATQNYSGYVEPHATVAHAPQSPAASAE